MNSKQSKLETLQQTIINQNVCPELAEAATQIVMGNGNPDAEMVFIGEAPGKKEDEQGLPFVGAAGKFLDEMLDTINLTREDVYVTNIVKYRPPGNRDPHPEEKQAFWPYLEQQLAILEPKLIVTLGRHSMEAFLPSFKISQIHGQPKRINIQRAKRNVQSAAKSPQSESDTTSVLGSDTRKQGSAQQTVLRAQSESTGAADAAGDQELSGSDELHSPAVESDTLVVMPLYHPAAALYNGGMRQTLFDDFAKIPKVLELIKQDRSK